MAMRAWDRGYVGKQLQSTCRGDDTTYVTEIQNKIRGADVALTQVTNKPGELLGMHADSRQRVFKKGVVHSVKCTK